ncbi:MAG: PKD domain-containing protein [Thermoanaerobaculia bacterium]
MKRGVDVKKHSTFALAALLCLFAATAVAQSYPMPAATPGTEVFCTTCPDPYTNLPTPAYQLPIKTFTGRFVDSQQVRNFQAGSGLRTLRARGTIVAPELDKVFIMLGQGLAAYKLSTFFTEKLGLPLTAVNASREGYYEKFLLYDWYAYAEGRNSGWTTKISDGQDRLFDADYDDRGNVYLAYSVFGWGMVSEANGKLVKQVFDTAAQGISPTRIMTLRSGTRYYALVMGGSEIGIWETTTPANPTFIRKWRASVTGWSKTSASGLIAIQSGLKTDIYNVLSLTGGGAPLATINTSGGYYFTGITSDGTDFYAPTSKAGSGIRLVKISASTLTDTTLETGVEFQPNGLTWGGGIFTMYGRDTTGAPDIRLLRLEGGIPREMPTGSYIKKYYYAPPAGYAKPAGYTNAIIDSRIVHFQGRDFLIHSQDALGDVYELQTRDSINIDHVRAFHGTDNQYSKGSGLYYGDPLKFRSGTSGEQAERIQWNFDNPEAPAAPLYTSTTGVDIEYQYVGAKTENEITRQRSVRAEVTTDDSNFATVKVIMQSPMARVGVKNTTMLFLQPNASATAPIVLGNEFVDASDGSIEGHYSVWTQDGNTTIARPDAPLNAGICGAHTLAYEGRYIPYVDGTTITPRYADTYALIRTIGSLDYTVRPFAASILIGTPTADLKIPFINRTAVGSASAFAGGTSTPVSVTWQLLDSSGGVLLSDGPRSLTLGTLKDDVFLLASSLVPAAGGTVTLKVDVLDSAIADAACKPYASSSASIAVKAPDPKITISNCTNVGSPCRLVAGSLSNADMTGWAVKWKVDGVQKSTSALWEMTSTTSKTYFPTAKTYTIELEATNAVTMRSVSQSLTLAPSLCNGAPKGVVIGWSGATSGCATGQCTTNEPISFNPTAWGYTFQDCDTFDWSFGDGSANSDQRYPTHTFPGNGPYTVTLVVKNSDGQTSANTTVQFGTAPPPPPPPPPGCPTKAPETVYIDWMGPASGCSAISGKNCITTENVQFTAEFLGYTVQACDTISWNFDNGRTASGKVVSTNFPTAKTYNVKVTITNTKGSKTRTTAIAVSAGTPPPTCPDTAPGGQLGLEWVGQTSGCKTGTGTANCMPGETLNFQLWLVGYSQQACDTFEWNFGDGQTTTTTSPLTTHTYGASVSGSVNVSVTVKNSKGSKNVSKAIFFGTSGSCEVPIVSINGPSRAGVGKVLNFQGSVTPADVEVVSWSWSFGPGQTAQGQNATHTFNAPGTYDVTLTVRTGCAKEERKVLRVTVADNSFAFLLPAVAHLELPTGTWKTDLQFFVDDANLATQPLELTVEWSSPTGVVSKQLLLQSSTLIYEDFMKFFDAQAQMASGAIVIRGASDIVPQIWTRTYIVPPSGVGSYGQLIPAIPLDDDPGAVTDPPSLILAGLQSAAPPSLYRTNIGIINPTNKPQTVSVALYDTQGFTIVAFDETVNPYTLNQVNVKTKLPANWVGSDHYSAKLWTASGDQIFAYASTIDNTSNDPVYQAAISDGDVNDEVWRKQVVVGVGHLGTWRSDVTVFNADSGPIQVNLTYLDQSGTKIAEALNVVIPARSFQHIEGLMRWTQFVPPQTGDTYGTLFVETKGAVTKFPMVFARTYNDQGELGTYGQGIAAFSAQRPNVTAQKAAVIPGVREERDDPDNKGYYTNIGLLNLTDQPTEVRIALLDEITGAEIGATGKLLGANESAILSHIIKNAPLHPSAARGTIKVQVVSGGPIWAFASIIDNKTKDAEYVPAVPLP